MKAWQLLPYVIGFVIGGAITWLTPGRGEAAHVLPLSNLEYHEQEERRGACRKARVTFFEECMKAVTRESCEVQWSSLRGHVFDGDPRNGIADEIDCGAIK